MEGFTPQLNNSQPNTGGKQEAVFHPKNIIFVQMGSCSAIMQALGGQWIFIWILNEPLDQYLQEVEARRLSPSIFIAVHTYTKGH